MDGSRTAQQGDFSNYVGVRRGSVEKPAKVLEGILTNTKLADKLTESASHK